MGIATDVRTYLTSKSSVTSLVGMRVFSGTKPQRVDAQPFIVYRVVSQDQAHDLGNGAGFAETRLQIDVYGKTPAERDSLVAAIRNVMQGYKGSMGESTVDSVVHKGATELYMRPQDQSDIGNWRTTTDYWIRHQQSIPTHA